MGSALRKYGLYINGKEVDSVSGKTYIRENPATEENFAEISEGQKEDIDMAVNLASKAFEKWSKTTVQERIKIVNKLSELIQKNGEHIAQTNTLETGKPIKESRLVEVGGSVRTLDYYSGAGDGLNGEALNISENQLTITLMEPVGVVAQIIPWNFPLLLSFWKIAPALIAGCTIVLKPSELTPCGIMEVARLSSDAGLPDGVFNVVPGYGEVAGQALVEHPMISKVAFTGSTDVGKLVMRTASIDLKRISLELGGKAPCIVFEDAEIDNAIEATLRGGYFNQGENCTAVTRLLLHEDIYDEFLSKYLDRVKKIVVDDPTKDETEMGSVISKEHFDNVSNYFQKGIDEGATILYGGKRPDHLSNGYFIEPTVLTDVHPSSTVACEEIFGPIVAVIPFKTDDEAITIANDTHYGLAGGIWTQDIRRALRTAKAVKAGYLWVNTYGGIIPETPYGGFKQSGFGKELGKDGLESYLEKKAVNIFIGDNIPAWYKG